MALKASSPQQYVGRAVPLTDSGGESSAFRRLRTALGLGLPDSSPASVFL